MKAYTISRLAADAGVSVHRIRHYEQRGLLRPCQCTCRGYRIYDRQALQRLSIIDHGTRAGIPLARLAELFQALDGRNGAMLRQARTMIDTLLQQRQAALHDFQQALRHIDEAAMDDRCAVTTPRGESL